ncbi:transcriptional regulator [Streptomyces nigrescens]
MTPAPSQRAAEPNTASGPSLHARMLADRLSAMLPHAATIQISLRDPRWGWARLDAYAYTATGERVRLGRTQTQIAARWIIRAHPEAGWQRPRTFDLRTAALDADGGR